MRKPEQERALRYVRKHGMEASLPHLQERTRRTFAQIEKLLDTVTEEEAKRRLTPKRWCIYEIVDHLVESHRSAARELESLLAGQRPQGGPIPAGLQSPNPLTRPWDDLLGALKEVHINILALLAGADGGLVADARAPVVMVVEVQESDGSAVPLEWVEELDWKAYTLVVRVHTLEHLNEIKAARKITV